MIVDILLIKSLQMLDLNTTSNFLLHQFSHMPKIKVQYQGSTVRYITLHTEISVFEQISQSFFPHKKSAIYFHS